MHISYWIAGILIGYFFLIFVVMRVVVPYMGFGALPVAAQVPADMQQKITEMESRSATPQEYLQAAYNLVTSRYHAGRLDTIRYANLAFRTNLDQIWQSPGYAHCNTQNYLLFVLLTHSKFFKPEDIKLKTVFFNFWIHQYIQVKVDNKWIDADPAGDSIRGKPLGTHINIFG